MPDKVFVNDTVLITLSTGKVMSTFTLFRIKYEKPDRTKGFWAAALHPSNSQAMRATVSFDQVGIWKIQAYIAKVGEKYHGMWADVKVYKAIAPTTTTPPTTVPPTT